MTFSAAYPAVSQLPARAIDGRASWTPGEMAERVQFNQLVHSIRPDQTSPHSGKTVGTHFLPDEFPGAMVNQTTVFSSLGPFELKGWSNGSCLRVVKETLGT